MLGLHGMCVPAWLVKIQRPDKDEQPSMILADPIDLQLDSMPGKLQIQVLKPNPLMINGDRSIPIELTRMPFEHEQQQPKPVKKGTVLPIT